MGVLLSENICLNPRIAPLKQPVTYNNQELNASLYTLCSGDIMKAIQLNCNEKHLSIALLLSEV